MRRPVVGVRFSASQRTTHRASIPCSAVRSPRSPAVFPLRLGTFHHRARLQLESNAHGDHRMTLHISEAEVRQVLTMPMALQAVEEISRKQAAGEVIVHPRRRFELPSSGFFHYMAAAEYKAGLLAMKQYTFVRGKMRFLVPLYEITSGDLVAMIEADYMGQLRTGAASGVATKYLARRDAS